MNDLTQKIDKAIQDLAWIEEKLEAKDREIEELNRENADLKMEVVARIRPEVFEQLQRELAIATAELEKK